jgi:hypothetical protein
VRFASKNTETRVHEIIQVKIYRNFKEFFNQVDHLEYSAASLTPVKFMSAFKSAVNKPIKLYKPNYGKPTTR